MYGLVERSLVLLVTLRSRVPAEGIPTRCVASISSQKPTRISKESIRYQLPPPSLMPTSTSPVSPAHTPHSPPSSIPKQRPYIRSPGSYIDSYKSSHQPSCSHPTKSERDEQKRKEMATKARPRPPPRIESSANPHPIPTDDEIEERMTGRKEGHQQWYPKPRYFVQRRSSADQK